MCLRFKLTLKFSAVGIVAKNRIVAPSVLLKLQLKSVIPPSCPRTRPTKIDHRIISLLWSRNSEDSCVKANNIVLY